MLAPRSRGKGSRRWPGRDGGRGKRKGLATWRKHAQHAATSIAELTQPLEQVVINGFYRDSADDFIYKFDQCMAQMGLQYYAECTGRRHRWSFTIWVPSDKAPDVREIIAGIKK
jgi:hypothetical protein